MEDLQIENLSEELMSLVLEKLNRISSENRIYQQLRTIKNATPGIKLYIFRSYNLLQQRCCRFWLWGKN